ncbi:hypothetical protein CK203_057621 [Vitis vinifera]|uniref:Uncharacterized protein n=1 Tax=Vitis vinifera TaxID=29760 RepID=A0A438GNL6_VITVI|nr:hypothetical protein CK203_057621 [Vitis vinifera]
MGFPQTNIGSLVQALYGIEEGISRGLWADSSLSDSKGKKSGSGPRPSDVGTICMISHKSPCRPPTQRQFSDTSYKMIQHDQYRPTIPIKLVGPAYLHPSPQPVYATQAFQKPPMQFHQYRAPPPPRPTRQFTQLGMSLSRAFQRLVEEGLIAPLPPRLPPQPTLPGFRIDLHWFGDLGRPAVTKNPLPSHDTRVVLPLPGGIHLIEHTEGDAPRPFRLALDKTPRRPLVPLGYLQHALPLTPFILFPEGYGSTHRDVQIVTWSWRVAHPPPIDTPFSGHQVLSVLLDNGSALNICHLVIAIALGFSPSDFGPYTQTDRAYEGTQRIVIGYTSTEEDARYMARLHKDRVQIMHPTWRGSLIFQRLLRFKTSNGPWGDAFRHQDP